MDFSENITAKYSEQTEENQRLISDISSLKDEYEREHQTRIQYERQLEEANKLMEMVKIFYS